MRKDRFRGYGPYLEILTIKQSIRDLHSALRIACHIIIATVILPFSVIALWILAGILTFLLLMACCYYCCWHVCCGRYVKKMGSNEVSWDLTTYPSLKSS